MTLAEANREADKMCELIWAIKKRHRRDGYLADHLWGALDEARRRHKNATRIISAERGRRRTAAGPSRHSARA